MNKRLNLSKLFVFFLFLCECGASDTVQKQYKKAVTLYYSQQRDLAIKEFRKTNELEPGYQQTNLFLGKLYFFRQEYKKALKALRIYANHHPDASQGLLWVIKTEYILQKIKPKNLLVLLDSYLSRDTSNPEVLFMYAKTLQRANKGAKAIVYYEQIIRTMLLINKSSQELATIFDTAELPAKAQLYRNFSKILDKQSKLLLHTNNSKKTGQR